MSGLVWAPFATRSAAIRGRRRAAVQKKMIDRSCGIHRAVHMTERMVRFAGIALVVTAVSAAWAIPAQAADEARACLSKSEQRAAISTGHAVTLAQAIR